MPGITPLVALVSQNVNASLLAQGLPPLQDGGIVNGRVRLDENPAPPRVVFILKGSKFEPRQRYNRSNKPGGPAFQGAGVAAAPMGPQGSGYTQATTTVTFPAPTLGAAPAVATGVAVVRAGAVAAIAMTSPGAGYASAPTPTIADSGGGTGATAQASVLLPTAEQMAIWAQRSLYTDVAVFEVHCWSQAAPPDEDEDFDASQALYQTVIAQCHLTVPGSFKPTSGIWTDSKPGATQIMLAGHEFVFTCEFRTPLLDAALGYAPPGTQAAPSVYFQPYEGGAPEPAP